MVEFTAAGQAMTKKSEIAGYQFVVTSPGEVSETFYSADGNFSYEFGPEGEYAVEALVADSFGSHSSTPASSKIVITNPFAAATWGMATGSVYQNQSFALDAGPLAAASYKWFVYKPSIDPLEDTDGDGYANVPVLSGEGASVSAVEGIDEVKKGYIVYLVIEDKYGNRRELTDIFDVKSEEDPAAEAGVFADLPLADNTIGRKEVSVEGVQPTVYEDAPLFLDSSVSKAGAEGSGLSVSRVVWDVVKDGLFINQIEAADAGDVIYTPDLAGTYEFSLKIENNLGRTDQIMNPISIVVSENKPLVSQFTLSAGPYYEGVEMVLDVSAASPSENNGAITEVLWDIEGLSNDISYQIADGDTVYDLPWSPYYFEASTESKEYRGQITVKNVSGRVSDPFPFSFTVIDNNPVANLTLSPATVFWGRKVVLDSVGSGSKDGDLSSLLLELLDDSGSPVTLEADNSYTLPAGTGNVEYTARLSVTNINGTVVSEKQLAVVEPILMADFVAKLAPGCNSFFSKQNIVLDASASMNANETPIARDKFEWAVTRNGTAYASGRSGAYTGTLFDAPSDGQFRLALGDAGVYQIKLTVFDAANTPCATPVVREIVVIDNIPNNLDIQVLELSSIDDNGVTKMEYRFTGSAVTPDGSALSYEWFNDKIPVGGLPPSAVGSSAVFAYQGGEHTVYLAAKNSAGAVAVKSVTFVSFDFIPPEPPTVQTSESNPTKNETPAFNWIPQDAAEAAAYRIQFDSESAAGWLDMGTATTFTPGSSLLSNGLLVADVVLYVQVADATGNWSTSGTLTLSIDTEAPVAPIVSTEYVDNLTNSDRPKWSWTHAAEADVDTYRWRIDAGAWTETPLKSYTSLTALSAGTYAFEIQAADAAGNWSVSDSLNLTIDQTPPLAPVVSSTPQTNDPTPVWSWAAGDADAYGYRYQFNAEDPAGWAEVSLSTTTYAPATSLTSGGYTVYVQARDKAGNWSSSGSSSTVIDVDPPAVPSLSAVTPVNTDASWSWVKGSVDTASFRYQLNSESAAGWSAESESVKTYTETGSAEGSYTLYVQARDAAGNWSASASKVVTVDLTPPAQPTVTTDAVLFTTTALYQWNDDADTTGYRWQFNSESAAGWTVIADLISTTQVAPAAGSNTFYVQAKDEAGNWSTSGSAVIVCGSPVVGVAGSAPLGLNYGAAFVDPGVTVSINGVDVLSLVTVAVGGEVIDARKVGAYVVNYTVSDSRSNTEAPVTRTVNVAAPTAPAIVNGNFEAADDGTAPGWNWHMRGYVVKGGWSQWYNYVDTTGAIAAYTGEFAIDLGSVVVCNSNSKTGSIGNINHPTDSHDGVAGKSNVAACPRNAKTQDNVITDCFMARSMGTLTQADLPVFAGVTYQLTGISYANGSTHDANNILKIVGQGAVTFVENSLAEISNANNIEDSWYSHAITFTPVIDGNVSIVFVKTDISGGARDNGGSYYDDAAMTTTAWPVK